MGESTEGRSDVGTGFDGVRAGRPTERFAHGRNPGRHLTSGVPAGDLFALAAPPAAICGTYLLPESARSALALRYTEPSVLAAYGAHLVHFEVVHLAGNLLGYGLLATTCYLLAVATGLRRFLLVAAAGIALAFPPALSGLNLVVPRDAITYGFSGLNAALFGLLAVLSIEYLRATFCPTIERRDAGAVFFPTVAVAALLVLPPSWVAYAVAAAAATITGGYLLSIRGRGRDVRTLLVEVRDRPGYGDLLLVVAVIAVGYPAVAFTPTATVGVPNVYTHVLGYALGFLAPYLLLSTGLFDD